MDSQHAGHRRSRTLAGSPTAAGERRLGQHEGEFRSIGSRHGGLYINRPWRLKEESQSVIRGRFWSRTANGENKELSQRRGGTEGERCGNGSPLPFGLKPKSRKFLRIEKMVGSARRAAPTHFFDSRFCSSRPLFDLFQHSPEIFGGPLASDIRPVQPSVVQNRTRRREHHA